MRVVAAAPAMTLYGLGADGSALYWRSCPAPGQPQVLVRHDHGAPAPRVIVSAPALGRFALDGEHVYISGYDRVLRVGKAGGPVVEAVLGEPIADLAVAADAVYVAIADTRKLVPPSPTPHVGRIVRVPKDGGAPSTVADHDGSVPRLAVDDRTIYFTTDDTVYALPLAGGPPRELARDEANHAGSLALAGDSVVFCAGGEVRRVPKAGGAVEVLYRAQIVLSVRVHRGVVLAARNLAYDRGTIAERAAIVRISRGRSEIVADLDAAPHALAADDRGVYALLVALGPGIGREPDRVVQAVAADDGRWYDRDTTQE